MITVSDCRPPTFCVKLDIAGAGAGGGLPRWDPQAEDRRRSRPGPYQQLIEQVTIWGTALLVVTRRVLTDKPVHRLPDEVGVPHVARVLLDHVDEQPPQAGGAAVA
jgi:hypothetical protein